MLTYTSETGQIKKNHKYKNTRNYKVQLIKNLRCFKECAD